MNTGVIISSSDSGNAAPQEKKSLAGKRGITDTGTASVDVKLPSASAKGDSVIISTPAKVSRHGNLTVSGTNMSEPTKLLGCVRGERRGDDVLYVVHWTKSSGMTLVPSAIMRNQSADEILDFHESRIFC